MKKQLTDEELNILMKPAVSHLQSERAKKRWSKQSPEDRHAHAMRLAELSKIARAKKKEAKLLTNAEQASTLDSDTEEKHAAN